ncbi:MAG: helix-turn-helix domain-containing protein [Bacteroidia bacterium]|nr:helix-turn-helix domain-containing protein [Bacteroidia bacterium]
MTDESIIKNIERFREERGMSQDMVAIKIGKARNTYGNIVRGKTKILNENLQALADVFGVSVEEILLGYKPGDPSSLTLGDNDNHREQMHQLTEDYERRLSEDRLKIEAQAKQIITLENYVKTLQDMVALLQKK